jgi:hypothetical protein
VLAGVSGGDGREPVADGGAVRPSEGADPPPSAVASTKGGGWVLGFLTGWFGGAGVHGEVAMELA